MKKIGIMNKNKVFDKVIFVISGEVNRYSMLIINKINNMVYKCAVLFHKVIFVISGELSGINMSIVNKIKQKTRKTLVSQSDIRTVSQSDIRLFDKVIFVSSGNTSKINWRRAALYSSYSYTKNRKNNIYIKHSAKQEFCTMSDLEIFFLMFSRYKNQKEYNHI